MDDAQHNLYIIPTIHSTMPIEVEIRGPLTEEEFARVSAFLIKNGKEHARKERVLVAFDDDDPLLDVRVRITNGVPELIVKKGRFGASEAREEFSTIAEKGQFIPLVKTCFAMGYRSGIIAERNSHVYEYDDVEFALIDVPGHSKFFEAEMLVNDIAGSTDAREHILATCSALRLSVFDEEGFTMYVRKLDAESNKPFKNEDEALQVLKDMGHPI